ncbi:hypothetical protein GCM10010377_74850 [Streptomyces viridiviolaceus]|uniref:Low temperature requirement protein A n=1 Tax=Streptomyces viridiviolaceus TaxID=68282 RepID=A0ABW2DV14_9ACTN|nr:low temperature requirement protein A [Streptomyces viridiviolaceus]GHB73441.1 hypothetical protein GCM10010377_74850 [Streptomyces viridiviolaceus]
MSPLELFFDLIFVFAVSQPSHHLVDHLTWRGGAETAVLLVGAFGTWAFTSFAATLLDIDLPRTRLTVIVVMGLGLSMNAAISRAFTTAAWLFVVPLLLIMVGVQAPASLAAPSAGIRHHYQRGLVWTAVSAPLWVTGAAVSPGPRLWWWAAAPLIDLTGTWLAHPLPGRVLRSAHLAFDASTCSNGSGSSSSCCSARRFLTTGTTISDATVDLSTVEAFVALVCLWAVYFGGGEDVVAVHVGTSSAPIRSVRWGINVTYCALAALVAVVVGSELVISHPHDHTTTALALLLFGALLLPRLPGLVLPRHHRPRLDRTPPLRYRLRSCRRRRTLAALPGLPRPSRRDPGGCRRRALPRPPRTGRRAEGRARRHSAMRDGVRRD